MKIFIKILSSANDYNVIIILLLEEIYHNFIESQKVALGMFTIIIINIRKFLSSMIVYIRLL